MKPIPNCDGYFATEDGDIFSNRKGPTKKLNPTIRGRGYLTVDVLYLGKTKNKRIHRLILETFVGPCPDGMQTRHLDGNPSNNRPTNLSWGTAMQNHEDKVRHGNSIGARGEKNRQAKLSEVEVYKIRNSNIAPWFLAEIFGVGVACIKSVQRRVNWRHI